jgi:hypothetical protein
MNTAEIPSQILNEAYKAIADRREASPAALDRQTVDEPEFMAALAYVLGIPLVEKADLTQALLADCGQLAAELETAALMEYKFVPLARRGETLVVISSSPWDPITTEVLLGYFQQCSQIKFALASPQCLQELFDYLKQAEAKTQETAVAGYTPKPLPAKTIISEPPGAVAPSAIPPAARTGERTPAASIVMPPGAKPPAAATAAPPAATTINSPAQADRGSRILTLEDITHLINVLAMEIQRLAQQRTRRSL